MIPIYMRETDLVLRLMKRGFTHTNESYIILFACHHDAVWGQVRFANIMDANGGQGHYTVKKHSGSITLNTGSTLRFKSANQENNSLRGYRSEVIAFSRLIDADTTANHLNTLLPTVVAGGELIYFS